VRAARARLLALVEAEHVTTRVASPAEARRVVDSDQVEVSTLVGSLLVEQREELLDRGFAVHRAEHSISRARRSTALEIVEKDLANLSAVIAREEERQLVDDTQGGQLERRHRRDDVFVLCRIQLDATRGSGGATDERNSVGNDDDKVLLVRRLEHVPDPRDELTDVDAVRVEVGTEELLDLLAIVFVENRIGRQIDAVRAARHADLDRQVVALRTDRLNEKYRSRVISLLAQAIDRLDRRIRGCVRADADGMNAVRFLLRRLLRHGRVEELRLDRRGDEHRRRQAHVVVSVDTLEHGVAAEATEPDDEIELLERFGEPGKNGPRLARQSIVDRAEERASPPEIMTDVRLAELDEAASQDALEALFDAVHFEIATIRQKLHSRAFSVMLPCFLLPAIAPSSDVEAPEPQRLSFRAATLAVLLRLGDRVRVDGRVGDERSGANDGS